MTTLDREVHGCGHFWCNATYVWDTYTETAGFWWYDWNWKKYARQN